MRSLGRRRRMGSGFWCESARSMMRDAWIHLGRAQTWHRQYSTISKATIDGRFNISLRSRAFVTRASLASLSRDVCCASHALDLHVKENQAIQD